MLVPLVIGSALLMQFLDSTAVMTALPKMAQSLDSDPASLSIIVSAYMLSLSVFIPASGWIADRWGARTIFQIAIAIFTIAHGALSLPVALLAVVVVAAIVFVTWRHARKSPAPILDLSLFRFPTFRISNTGGMVYRCAFNGALLLQPVLLQSGFGMDAIH